MHIKHKTATQGSIRVEQMQKEDLLLSFQLVVSLFFPSVTPSTDKAVFCRSSYKIRDSFSSPGDAEWDWPGALLTRYSKTPMT